MQNKIEFQGREIPFEIKKSKRKTIAIHIDGDGNVEVRAHGWITKRELFSVVEKRAGWIIKKQEELEKRKEECEANGRVGKKTMSVYDRDRYKKLAKEVIGMKVDYYANYMKLSYGTIRIKEQKTRWGSCSSKGNLNFNWKLILMPEEVMDYVVVHELCHLKHMNHSREFWGCVASILPDYKERKRRLRELEPGVQFEYSR